MILTTHAVYENGVLKVPHHLPVPEGERVQVVIVHPFPVDVSSPEEVERRKKLVERMRQHDAELDAADADDGYDLIEAINAERIRSGARPIVPSDEGPK